jgi:hypothetical protein
LGVFTATGILPMGKESMPTCTSLKFPRPDNSWKRCHSWMKQTENIISYQKPTSPILSRSGFISNLSSTAM